MNILANAIDALEEAPGTQEILIRTEMLNSNVVAVRIVDNRPGMTEEIKTRLFDPFFTTKAPGKGTGLGLSISYGIIVQKHQGALKCVSEKGQGTEFWIEIPVMQAVEVLDSQKLRTEATASA